MKGSQHRDAASVSGASCKAQKILERAQTNLDKRTPNPSPKFVPGRNRSLSALQFTVLTTITPGKKVKNQRQDESSQHVASKVNSTQGHSSLQEREKGH